MKHQISIYTFALLSLCASCGQSAEQKAQDQQRHDDSLKTAIEVEIRTKTQIQEDSIKSSLETRNSVEKEALRTQVKSETINNVSDVVQKEKQYKEGNMVLSRLNILLEQTRAKLAVVSNEYNKDKEFHIGRTKGSRDKEIYNDAMYIQAYQKQVQEIEQRISEVQQKLADLKTNISTHQI